MNAPDAQPTAPRLSTAMLALCLALVWVVWGTTYLAIRVAIATLPPLLTAGARFLVAGTLLVAFARLRGAPWPTRRQLLHAAGLGVLFFLLGNGAVVVAETRIPSGAAALVVALEPIFVVALSWRRPSVLELAGMALSTLGLVLLAGTPGPGAVDPVGLGIVLIGCVGWALGSVWVPRADLPRSSALAAGLEMLGGGTALLLGGLARGEAFDPARATLPSLLAVGYLVLAGSIVAFSAYQMLARSAAPALVATYAYVNPVVAVAAGVLLGGERASSGLMLASAAIVGGVVLITVGPALQRRLRPPLAERAEVR